LVKVSFCLEVRFVHFMDFVVETYNQGFIAFVTELGATCREGGQCHEGLSHIEPDSWSQGTRVLCQSMLLSTTSMLTSSHLVCCWFQIHDLRRFFLFIIISTVTACVTDFRTDTVTSCDLQVLEIRPGIAWDKGQAVNFLLESLGN
jgi:hypothetical protein